MHVVLNHHSVIELMFVKVLSSPDITVIFMQGTDCGDGDQESGVYMYSNI